MSPEKKAECLELIKEIRIALKGDSDEKKSAQGITPRLVARTAATSPTARKRPL
jgi:hypothetical protein